MAQATLWFAGPFRDWIGQRTLTLTWEGTLTVRDLWKRLAADYPSLRANLPAGSLQEDAMSQIVAVIMDGDILTLDAAIRDGAKVDVLTPLSGGAPFWSRMDCYNQTPNLRLSSRARLKLLHPRGSCTKRGARA